MRLLAILILTTFSATSAPRAGEQRYLDSGTAARTEFSRGLKALEEGRIDLARRAFSEAVALAPEWGLAYLQWGIVEESVDPEAPTALQCLMMAAELAPQNPRAHYHLGVLFDRLGRVAEAVEEFRRALALRSNMKGVQFRLASALSTLGRAEDAIAAYGVVLERDPEHTGALTALAELYERTKQLGYAEDALVAITHAQPQVAYHHYRLAQFYERVGDATKAKRAFARAERLDPQPQRKMRRLR